MNDSPQPLFDRALMVQRRDGAAATLSDADFLLAEVFESMAERLGAIQREFRRIAVVGAWDGRFAAWLAERYAPEKLVQLEFAPAMLGMAAEQCPSSETVLIADDVLPLALGAFDLVVCPLILQAVEDVPGALIQMHRALSPDGLFLGAMLGGQTLSELRAAFLVGEAETVGGSSPRVAPFADLRDLGGLLQRAGFALPVADREMTMVRYGNPMTLMQDLRRMGFTNPLVERRRVPLRRDTLQRSLAAYFEHNADPDGKLRASFEILWLHGWAPHNSQQQPLRPGSAAGRLADALGTTELPTGDKAER